MKCLVRLLQESILREECLKIYTLNSTSIMTRTRSRLCYFNPGSTIYSLLHLTMGKKFGNFAASEIYVSLQKCNDNKRVQDLTLIWSKLCWVMDLQLQSVSLSNARNRALFAYLANCEALSTEERYFCNVRLRILEIFSCLFCRSQLIIYISYLIVYISQLIVYISQLDCLHFSADCLNNC